MSGLSSSIYQTLPENSIRVLELQPGEAHEALSCRLTVQLISGDSYEAISYVWGDPTKNATLFSNGKSVGITSNLGEALTAFRTRHTVRRLWADAICINQQDNREREVQVGLMRLIYSSAKNVLGWIGPDPGTALLAIAFIHKFNEDPDTQIQAARALQLTDKEHNIDSKCNIEIRWTVWIAIKALFEMPFFHRVWIVQELGLAKQAQLYYGLQSIDWRQVSNFVFIMDNQAAFLVTYLELKSWMVNHTVLIWQTLGNGQPRYSFIEVLNWARIHQATDARDTIYGFLGHPSAMDRSGKLIIHPDYEASADEIFTEFARTWINRTKGLKVLSAVDRNLEEPEGASIPTWVPAWNTGGCAVRLRPVLWCISEFHCVRHGKRHLALENQCLPRTSLRVLLRDCLA